MGFCMITLTKKYQNNSGVKLNEFKNKLVHLFFLQKDALRIENVNKLVISNMNDSSRNYENMPEKLI